MRSGQVGLELVGATVAHTNAPSQRQIKLVLRVSAKQSRRAQVPRALTVLSFRCFWRSAIVAGLSGGSTGVQECQARSGMLAQRPFCEVCLPPSVTASKIRPLRPRGDIVPVDSSHSKRVVADLRKAGFDASGLEQVGVVPALPDYLRQLWNRRTFIWMDARQRVATQNSRNVLGNVWLVLRPLLDALFYYILFGLVLQIDRGIENYPAFIIIGILLFSATSRAMSQGPTTVKQGRPLIRAFSFPRAAIPLAGELRNALQSVPAVATMLVMIILIPPHVIPTWTWILLPLVLSAQVAMNLGLRMILARVGFHFPDTAQLMSFVSRVIFFTSGVIIPVTRFEERVPALMPIIEFNPIYQMLHIARDMLKEGSVGTAFSWGVFLGWTVVFVVVGFWLYWRGEARYGADE